MTAASLIEGLTRGDDPNRALVEYARSLAELPQYPYRYRLPALAAALGKFESLQPGIHAALAVHAHRADHPGLAKKHLAACGVDAPSLIPVEFARISLADGIPADTVLDAVLPSHELSPDEWFDILAAVAATHDLSALGRATTVLSEQAASWGDDDQRIHARFVEYADRKNVAQEPPAGGISFGIMGYRRPDARTGSKNVGDFIQTISVLSHVLRRSGLRLTGDPDLVASGEALRARIRPSLMIDGDSATVELVEVSRDDSPLDVVPPNTWFLAFGWHLHADALGGHGLPYHPNLRPIFIAFHCNRREMLTDDAVDYLCRHAPIGCRDWYTVDMLTHLGIPAFFTGCVTTTVDAYFDTAPTSPDLPRGFVDSRPPHGQAMHQADPTVRHLTLAENLQKALDTLDRYRTEYGALTTSRLHCFLPATSIGIPTEFKPPRTFDVRFEGLTDEAADLDAMRTRLRDTLLEPMVNEIVSGATADEVYALWRSITQPLVDADLETRSTAYPWPTSTLDSGVLVNKIRSASWTRSVQQDASRILEVAVSLDQNYLTQLYTVMDRALELTRRPIRLWALVRGLDQGDFERFATAFPELDVTFLPCDAVEHQEVTVGARRITISTMDRLLLPDLLQLDKVTYLDLDLLPRADLAQLCETDLGDAAIAARSIEFAAAMGTVASFHDVARNHFPDDVDGWRLLNLVHRSGHAGDSAFNAGVMVMNLAKMRSDNFWSTYAGFAERFGLNDQYVLNLYAGDSYRALPARWNAWPAQDAMAEEPALIHWVGPMKPWDDMWVGYQDEWHQAVATMLTRRRIA